MGIFGSDYESAGVGIPKNAPKKKGAARFFELLFRKFWKLIELNILYSFFFTPLILALYAFLYIENRTVALTMIVFCILIFALVFGPATAGMMKILRNYTLEKHAFILTDFKKAFVENYKKSVVIGIIDILLFISVGAAAYVYPKMADVYGKGILVLLVITLSVGIMAVMMNFYVFLMTIATELSFKNIIKNSFALGFVALKRNALTFVISLLIIAAVAVLIMFVKGLALFLVFVPASIVAFVICFNSYPVIQKYVINPYYEQRGEKNPELEEDDPSENEEVLFEDKGGEEKPIEKKKNKKQGVKSGGRTGGKGKIIS